MYSKIVDNDVTKKRGSQKQKIKNKIKIKIKKIPTFVLVPLDLPHRSPKKGPAILRLIAW